MYLLNQEPLKMLHFFEDISRIPRGSGNEKGIADFLEAFAKERKLFYVRDGVNNFFIRKPASAGYENVPAIMLQGHTDMVCEKNADVSHDFEKDPIALKVKNGWLYADGTTLGGDDGAAVAAMLAVLDSDDLQHPELECLFTVGEETSLVGAAAFDYSVVNARRILNLDTEKDGEAINSCAGSTDLTFRIDTTREPIQSRALKITVKGLAGGHSGAVIHLPRENAIRVMGNLLTRVWEDTPFRLLSIDGGNKRNAIPRECVAEIECLDKDAETRAKEILKTYSAQISKRSCFDDRKFTVRVDKGSVSGTMISYRETSRVLSVLTLSHNGVYRFMQDGSRFVRTSASMGVLKTIENAVEATVMARSSCEDEIKELLLTYKRLSEALDVGISVEEGSLGWDFDPESRLAADYLRVYTELFGKESDPKVGPIHAGLECGIIVSRLGKGCDALSIGPTIENIHTPGERLDLDSCARFWKLLTKMIAIK